MKSSTVKLFIMDIVYIFFLHLIIIYIRDSSFSFILITFSLTFPPYKHILYFPLFSLPSINRLPLRLLLHEDFQTSSQVLDLRGKFGLAYPFSLNPSLSPFPDHNSVMPATLSNSPHCCLISSLTSPPWLFFNTTLLFSTTVLLFSPFLPHHNPSPFTITVSLFTTNHPNSLSLPLFFLSVIDSFCHSPTLSLVFLDACSCILPEPKPTYIQSVAKVLSPHLPHLFLLHKYIKLFLLSTS